MKPCRPGRHDCTCKRSLWINIYKADGSAKLCGTVVEVPNWLTHVQAQSNVREQIECLVDKFEKHLEGDYVAIWRYCNAQNTSHCLPFEVATPPEPKAVVRF